MLIGIIILVIVVLLVIFLIAAYNGLVKARNRVDNAFSQIEVQQKRRYDLIPNLVETVKGYAAHERETLDQVIAHRTDAVSAKGVEATAQADNMMSAMLGRLIAVAEAYPDLKADENFRQLQDELSGLEGELQGARRYYNAAVRDLNTRVRSFPDMLFAGPLGFGEEPYYQDDDAAIQTAPKVEFANPA